MATCLGSSPLTRGTREKVHLLFLRTRFIPAYAGNSTGYLKKDSAGTVHPRLRGELVVTGISVSMCAGSSPLTRGTQSNRSQSKTRLRFIPAYAGNSSQCRHLSKVESVHPRLRGELAHRFQLGQESPGSSPLTRGTPDLIQHYEDHQRFIPAYAGNSLWRYKELTL